MAQASGVLETATENNISFVLEKIENCLKGDQKPWTCDLAVLCDGTAIVVTDKANNTLTSYYKDDDGTTCGYRLEVYAPPFGITELNPHLAAVTFEEVKMIALLNVNPDLSQNRILDVQQFYLGIAKLNEEQLVLSYSCEGSNNINIDILNIQGEGKVLKTITTDLPHRMNYIAVTPSQDILVSVEVLADTLPIVQATIELDNPNYEGLKNRSALFCLDLDGNKKFKYPKEKAPGFFLPRGVACNAEGYIFLASLDANIFMIKPDGSEGWIVESKAGGFAIATGLDVKGDKIFFCSGNTVRIYRLKDQKQ